MPVSISSTLPPSPPRTPDGVVVGALDVVAVELVVGVDRPPAIVRLKLPRWLPQVNCTEYWAPGRAAGSTVATADVPGLMVTASKIPDDAVAVVLQPLAESATRPPGATVEGLTVK